MIALYAIAAFTLGIVSGALTSVAQGLCYIVPWPWLHWITLKVQLHARAQDNWPAMNMVRKAAAIGAPYVSYYRPNADGVYVKAEDIVRQMSDDYERVFVYYQTMRLVCLELTQRPQDEIDRLVSERLPAPWLGKN